MSTSVRKASPLHEEAYQDFCVLLKKYEARGVTGVDMLALASNVVGKLIALLDQTRYTEEEAMEIVCSNLEAGNQQILDELMNRTAGSA